MQTIGTCSLMESGSDHMQRTVCFTFKVPEQSRDASVRLDPESSDIALIRGIEGGNVVPLDKDCYRLKYYSPTTTTLATDSKPPVVAFVSKIRQVGGFGDVNGVLILMWEYGGVLEYNDGETWVPVLRFTRNKSVDVMAHPYQHDNDKWLPYPPGHGNVTILPYFE